MVGHLLRLSLLQDLGAAVQDFFPSSEVVSAKLFTARA